MADRPTILSINEPHTSQPMASPVSINEPQTATEPPWRPEHRLAPAPAEPAKTASSADPDDLEDELEQMEEEGDFEPVHPSRKTKR